MENFKPVKSLFNSSKTGYCRICGEFCTLTADHIPPKSCFNSTPIYVNSPYPARIDKGLKIRSICENCNSKLLGITYDEELKSFVDQLRSHLRTYNLSEDKNFHKAKIFVDKEKVLRAILGHLLSCYSTQEELDEEIDLSKDCYTNRMRQYVQGKENGFYNEIRTLFWIHPYDSIRIIPAVSMMNVFKSANLVGTLISFRPIGIFIIGSENSFHINNKQFNEIKIDNNKAQVIDLSLIKAEDYPFNLMTPNSGIAFLLNHKYIIHGARPTFGIENPLEPNLF